MAKPHTLVVSTAVTEAVAHTQAFRSFEHPHIWVLERAAAVADCLVVGENTVAEGCSNLTDRQSTC